MEELVQDGAVEPLDKAVGLRCPDLGPAVLDAVEIKVEFVGMVLGAAEFPAIVGQHSFHRQAELAIEGQYLIVQPIKPALAQDSATLPSSFASSRTLKRL